MVVLNYPHLQLLNTINHSGKLAGDNDRHLLMEPEVIRVYHVCSCLSFSD